MRARARVVDAMRARAQVEAARVISGEEEAAAALKQILALPEREIAVVSDPRLLHHWTNAGQQPLAVRHLFCS